MRSAKRNFRPTVSADNTAARRMPFDYPDNRHFPKVSDSIRAITAKPAKPRSPNRIVLPDYGVPSRFCPDPTYRLPVPDNRSYGNKILLPKSGRIDIAG